MKSRGRKRTGTVYKHGDHLDVRITLPSGRRGHPVHLEPGTSLARAREIALALTEAAAEEIAAEQNAISVSTWLKGWYADRRARGLTSVSDDEGRIGKWIIPEIGAKPMSGPRRVAKADIEALVEQLDEHVRQARCSWKTAMNCWGNITKLFKDACGAKSKALRVREDNPTIGVVGPDKGYEKAKSYLYPSEFLALVSCEAVPLRWRRVFAVAVYLYARVSEFETLEIGDVDFERGLIHIHRALDRESGRVAETKTGVKRRIPIEPTIRSLLEVLVEEARARGDRLLFVMPPESDLSDCLRRYLLRAGITREDLHANDATRKQITFHDLRATGLTWMAVRGDDPLRIQTRAGHERFDTTQRYIREAENLEGAITPEETFPALPAGLISSRSSSAGNDPPASGDNYAGSNPAGDAQKLHETPSGGSGEPPGDAPSATPNRANSDAIVSPDDLERVAGLRRLADHAREEAARIGTNDGVVLHLFALEIAGECDEAADAIARRRAS